ncbi:Uncharacterized protein TPAR_01207 [Tolypocladium paradoxum]|uniref:Secreted protein n=1 Tax=Tolypocladium paradoxum TaxID=94208 RepID=A0A2S4L809_9HYPO|nr:Uncharacterized protein TPAR_01207 [Tolypocladium paradoxum]
MKSLLLCAVMAVAHAALSDLPSGVVLDPTNSFGIQGAHEVPVEWDLPAFIDGPILTLNGTAEDVHKQLLEINPNYNEDFKMFERRSTDIEKRIDWSDTKVICSPELFGKCSMYKMWDGVNYLYSLPGQPRNGPGPGACGRVSCSGNTAILWCNDETEPKRLGSWAWIAQGAERVWGQCGDCGQAFQAANWNVIVKDARC